MNNINDNFEDHINNFKNNYEHIRLFIQYISKNMDSSEIELDINKFQMDLGLSTEDTSELLEIFGEFFIFFKYFFKEGNTYKTNECMNLGCNFNYYEDTLKENKDNTISNIDKIPEKAQNNIIYKLNKGSNIKQKDNTEYTLKNESSLNYSKNNDMNKIKDIIQYNKTDNIKNNKENNFEIKAEIKDVKKEEIRLKEEDKRIKEEDKRIKEEDKRIKEENNKNINNKKENNPIIENVDKYSSNIQKFNSKNYDSNHILIKSQYATQLSDFAYLFQNKIVLESDISKAYPLLVQIESEYPFLFERKNTIQISPLGIELTSKMRKYKILGKKIPPLKIEQFEFEIE